MLSQAQFPVHPLRPKSVSPSCGVVIRSTIPTFDERTYFPIAALPLWQSLHRKCRQSENSPRLLSSTHFPPTHTAAKIFFSEFFRKTVLWITTALSYCYPQHSFKTAACAAQIFAAAAGVVIQRTICEKPMFCGPVGLLSPAYCCSGHSFVVILRTMGLLFPAHFCCYRQHSFTLYLNKKAKIIKR